jgi:hypothetical protein
MSEILRLRQYKRIEYWNINWCLNRTLQIAQIYGLSSACRDAAPRSASSENIIKANKNIKKVRTDSPVTSGNAAPISVVQNRTHPDGGYPYGVLIPILEKSDASIGRFNARLRHREKSSSSRAIPLRQTGSS